MNKPKPIFIVGVPNDQHDLLHTITEQITKKFRDYHVICYLNSTNEPTFQVFYEKDFNEVKFEELKQIVKDKLNEKV